MLMALLPLAGWAADPEITAAPTAKANLAYTGLAQALINEGTASEGATLYYAAVDKGATAPATTAFAMAVPEAKNAGDYDVYYCTKKGETYSDAVKIEVAIAKVDLRVTAQDVSFTYGDEVPDITEFYTTEATDWKNGETVATVGQHPVSVPAFDTNAGTKTIMLTANEMLNYNVVFANGASCEVAIAKKKVTVNVLLGNPGTPGGTISYGQNVPLISFSTDDTDITIPSTTGHVIKQGDEVADETKPLAVGAYKVFGKEEDATVDENHTLVWVPADLTVAALDLENVEITGTITQLTYTGENQYTTATKDIVLKNGDITMTLNTDYEIAVKTSENADLPGDNKDQLINVGSYKVVISAKAGGNYTGSVEKPFTIAKANLYVKTKNATTVYDGNAYTPTQANDVTYVGLVGEDEGNALFAGENALTLTVGNDDVAYAVSQTNAGTYTIKVEGPATLDNYNVEYGNLGTLTITPAKVTITTKDQTKVYGAQHKLDAAAGYQTVAGDYADYVTVAPAVALTTYPLIKRETGEDVTAAGEGYAITATGASAGDNYEIEYTNTGKFTITGAKVTIWAEDKETVYNSKEEVKLTALIDGVTAADLNADLQAAVNAALSIDGDAVNAGTYQIVFDEDAITTAFAGLTNYKDVATVPGNFVIKKAPLKIKALDQALQVGEVVPAASAETVEILTEGVSDTDKAKLFDGTTKITLAFSAEGCVVPVDADKKLIADAAITGWNGTAATEDGIWVGGIIINAAAYNAAEVNYTLDADVATGAEAKAGKLTVTAATASVDLTENDAVAKITANDGKKTDVVLKNRELKANTWNVLVLPFEISTFDFCSAINGYAAFNVLDDITSPTVANVNNVTEVKFKLELDKIPANQPFLVKPLSAAGGDAAGITFANVVVAKPTADPTQALENGSFIGTYAKEREVGETDFWAVQSGEFKHFTNDKMKIKFTRAYIKLKGEPAAVRFYIEEADGTTTVIDNLNVDEIQNAKAEGWYTINGMKLDAAPTEKGIYINNGKKVVIK